MPSLYDPSRRQEMLERLDQLAPGRDAVWGRFTAPQMVTHLLEWFRMASGELPIAPRAVPLRWLLRVLFIYLLPFPKGASTAPALLARVPESWERDVAQLRERLAAVRPPAPGTALVAHPLFGRMSARDWGTLMYKHTDHHFRQFGV